MAKIVVSKEDKCSKMFPKSILSPCLVCNSLYKISLTNNPSLLETKVKVFESFSKYLHVDVEKINKSLKWDFHKESFPFCAACFLSAQKISVFEQEIKKLTVEIDCVVQGLKLAILKSYEEQDGQIQLKESSLKKKRVEHCTFLEKIYNYRNLVIQGEGTLSCSGVNIDAYSMSHDCMDEEVEIKYEPTSPLSVGCDDNLPSEGSNHDDYEGTLGMHSWKPVAEDEDIDTTICSKSRQKGSTAPETSRTTALQNRLNDNLPECIMRVMKSYGMLARFPMLVLNRIKKNKGGKGLLSSNTKTTQRPRSRSTRNTTKKARTAFKMTTTPEGNKSYAGVVLYPTLDGQERCGKCDKVFINSTKLVRHIKTVHAGIKEKCYYIRKNTTKCFKPIRTPEGEISYAGSRLYELPIGVRCGTCSRLSSSMQAALCHVRWYHLGEKASQVYKRRRAAYSVNRRVILGKKVPARKVAEAAELLKEKIILSEVLKGSSKGKNYTRKSPVIVKNTLPYKIQTRNSSGRVQRRISEKEDTESLCDEPLSDEMYNDPDLRLAQEEISGTANNLKTFERKISNSDCSIDTRFSENENNYKVTDVEHEEMMELVTTEDGGNREIITENQLKCGKGRVAIVPDMHEMQNHVNTHLINSAGDTSKRNKSGLHEENGKKYFRGIEVAIKEGKLSCGKCNQSFSCSSAVKRHVIRVHLGAQGMTSTDDFDDVLYKSESENGSKSLGGVTIQKMKDEKFQCNSCCDILESVRELRRHVRNCNTKTSNLKSSKGKEIFADNEIGKIRMIIDDDGGRRFFGGIEVISVNGKEQCGKCQVICCNRTAIQRHIKGTHLGIKQKSYRTQKPTEDLFFKVVDTEDGNKTFLGVTIKILGDGDGRYACDCCFKQFKKLDNIKKHIRYQHSDRRHKVKKLTKTMVAQANNSKRKASFTPDGLLYNGIECRKLADGNYQCGFQNENFQPCEKVHATSLTMIDHIRRDHKMVAKKKILIGKYYNRTVTTEDGRKIHAGVEMVKMDNGDLQCGACQKVFKSIRISCLMSHIINVHIKNDDGIFICPVCQKNCGYRHNLAKHMLSHKDTKSYVCDTCGLAYKQAASLTHHQRQVHKGIKRHTCEQCGKQYYHTRDFLAHQRRHTGEQPFQCSVCGKSFYSKYEMTTHERKHNSDKNAKNVESTSEEIVPSKASRGSMSSKKRRRKSSKRISEDGFDCDYCDNSFRTIAAAKKHMIEEHPESEGDLVDSVTSKSPSDKEEIVSNDRSIPSTRFHRNSTSILNAECAASMPSLEFMHAPVNENNGGSTGKSFNKNSPRLYPGPPSLTPMKPMYDYGYPINGRPPYQSNQSSF